MHAQSCRFAGLRWRRNGLHAVSSHENPSVADVKEYTKARDVVNHAYDCNQLVGTRVSHSAYLGAATQAARAAEKMARLTCSASHPR